MRVIFRGILALSFLPKIFAQQVTPPTAQPSAILCAGTIVDASGAAIALATVSLARDGSETLRTTSDAAGRFTFQTQQMPASGQAYVLTVSAAGFQTYNATVTAGDASMAVSLQVAGQADVIEVEGEAGSNIEPTETQLGDALSQQQIANVPLNGRSMTGLLALTPGVVPVSSVQPNAVVMSGVASTPPSESTTAAARMLALVSLSALSAAMY